MGNREWKERRDRSREVLRVESECYETGQPMAVQARNPWNESVPLAVRGPTVKIPRHPIIHAATVQTPLQLHSLGGPRQHNQDRGEC